MYESRSVRRMYRRLLPVVQAGSVPSAKAAFRLRSGMPLSSAASGTVSTRRSASGTPVVVVVVVVVGIAMVAPSSLFVTWSLYAGKRPKPRAWRGFGLCRLLAVRGRLGVGLLLAQLPAERGVDRRVDGLRNADNGGERHAPARMGEAAGRAHGEHAEHDGSGERGQAYVAGGDVPLYCLDDGRGGEGDDGRGEGCGLGDFHWLLLIYMGNGSGAAMRREILNGVYRLTRSMYVRTPMPV
nr:MAG TPA: hypothetical protein [Caudoviricetes sp.]